MSVVSIFKVHEKVNELEFHPFNNMYTLVFFCIMECKAQEFLDTWFSSPEWGTEVTGCFDMLIIKHLIKKEGADAVLQASIAQVRQTQPCIVLLLLS